MKKLLIALLIICLAGCSAKADDQKTVREFFAMDTVMNITVYGGEKDAALAAENEVFRLEKLLSISDSEGDIATLNNAGSVSMREDTAVLINKAKELYENAAGAFDITMYPLMELWGFYSGNHHVATESEISELLSATGTDKLMLDGEIISLPDGMGVDLGGITKGYASDKVAEVLREKGVKSAIVSLGGNIYAIGSNINGNPWNVGIQDPENAQGYAGVVAVSDMAVVTSGTYQRFFEAEGKAYHHILDPETGCPAESGLCSVSIICENGALADGLSTALLVMGLDEACEFWKSGTYDFEAVFITDNGRIYITSGLEESFKSNLPFEVVKQ